jgi:hypothetical protein
MTCSGVLLPPVQQVSCRWEADDVALLVGLLVEGRRPAASGALSGAAGLLHSGMTCRIRRRRSAARVESRA